MPKYEDFYRLLDQLTPEQVQEVRTHALRLVGEGEEKTTRRSVPRDLSFIGIIHAEADLAERSEDILNEEFGH